MWILFAFLAPALYAVGEIFDEYLSNQGFKNISSLIFFACLLNFIFIPVIFLIERPMLPPLHLIWPLIGVALTNLLYLYPYYKSLKIEDTSVVSAFFSFGKIIIPIFAFAFIGEVLQLREYVGIAIIILGNIFLAFHATKKKLTLSKAFYLIIFASTLLAIEGILFKYMFEQGMNWSTAVGGQLLISGVLGCTTLLLFKKSRTRIMEDRGHFRKNSVFFFTEELFTFLALAAETYAISLAPVSLVKGIGMAIPIFVLTYTVAVKRFRPKAFHEDTHRGIVAKKVFTFGLIIVGLLLIGVAD
ncbi:MAG: hypothetical protein JWO73_296 [Candidatus Taylorbacteria bacterium]|nr:hypothetical protein [Candidatus Taylorbacteria bacterium]